MRIRFSFFILICIASTLAWAQPATQPAASQPAAAKAPVYPPGVAAELDVPYVPNGDPAQVLDIFYPEKRAEKPQPLMIWIHGGGWNAGSKKGSPSIQLAAEGFIGASVEYRFSSKAKFPAQIQDCQAAIRFLRANAAKYNIDPDHIGVWGNSAGGHLVALLGTTGDKKIFPPVGGNEDQSDRVQAVVDFYGPTDFYNVIAQAEADVAVKNVFNFKEKKDPYSALIGANLGVDKEACEAVSPVHYVSKDNAPILILHGTADPAVPFAQSLEFYEALKKAGVDATLQRLPGAAHGGPAFGLPPVRKLFRDFIDKHLKQMDVKIQVVPDELATAPVPHPATAPAVK